MGAAMSADSARLRSARLTHWLVAEAYPVWAQSGWDSAHGGFHERLAAGGPVSGDSRRARVQFRQIYAFARAPGLGWSGDVHRLVADGIAHVRSRYLRPDGLFRTLVAPDGTVIDDRALLYDQAFAILALSAAERLLGPGAGLRQMATALVDRIRMLYKRRGPGFRSEPTLEHPLSSNPHMHLLEAAWAWCRGGGEPRWQQLVAEIVALALEHMIDPHTGAMREHVELQPAQSAGMLGRLIEPGHQFEWAWLLLQTACGDRDDVSDAHASILAVAKRLIDIGEAHGVRNGFVVNALLDDLTVQDPQARLWPQTERLKAHACMARRADAEQHWRLAGEAAAALEQYLHGAGRGLWHDRRLPDGSFVHEPAPASSFYHLVCAIGELGSLSSGYHAKQN